MTILDEIEKLWPIIASIIGVVVWLIRLEGTGSANAKRVDVLERNFDHLEQHVNNMENGIAKEITAVKEALARIEGYLKGIKEKQE